MTETRLRELYQQALAARGAAVRDRCVTPEAMLALVRREGAADERLATLDHVMACGACARELELLRAIERAGAESGAAGAVGADENARERAADVIPISRRARAPWRRLAPLALAASLVLAVGIGVLGRGFRPGAEEVVRGEGAAVTLLAPGLEVRAGGPVTFAWRPTPNAVRYTLEVLDTAGNVVFTAATSDTTATMTDARRLAPGAEYHWWVRAVDPEAAQRASPMRGLRVRSP